MDVDTVVGYEKVLEYRKFIEKVTKKKSIPVWHKSRGLEEWQRMLNKGYKLVAIGGFVIKEIKLPQELKYVNVLVKQAHQRGVRVHGLGVTGFSYLRRTFFDSVDSTSWMLTPAYGRFSYININSRNINTLSKTKIVNKNMRAVAPKLRKHTLKKWLYVVRQFDTDEWDFLNEYNITKEVV